MRVLKLLNKSSAGNTYASVNPITSESYRAHLTYWDALFKMAPRNKHLSSKARIFIKCNLKFVPGSNNGEPSKAKRVKPIPPPLDLNARTLYLGEAFAPPLPASPLDFPRETLPIRKR
jgi:hypothetical protein